MVWSASELMLIAKTNVVFVPRHFDPTIRRMIDIALEFRPCMIGDVVCITSAYESRDTGLHPEGEAFDFRVLSTDPMLPGNVQAQSRDEALSIGRQWSTAISEALGDDYDVVYKKNSYINPDSGEVVPFCHIHAEYDPK